MTNQIKKYIQLLYYGEIDMNKPYSIKRDNSSSDNIVTFTLNNIKYDKYIDNERLEIINNSLGDLYYNDIISSEVWGEVFVRLKKDLPKVYKKRCGNYTILIDEDEFVKKLEEVSTKYYTIEFTDVNNNKIISSFIMRDNKLMEGDRVIEME